MKRYYCDKCGKEMAHHHIIEIKFTGREGEKKYEKEFCNLCFLDFLSTYNLKE